MERTELIETLKSRHFFMTPLTHVVSDSEEEEEDEDSVVKVSFSKRVVQRASTTEFKRTYVTAPKLLQTRSCTERKSSS